MLQRKSPSAPEPASAAHAKARYARALRQLRQVLASLQQEGRRAAARAGACDFAQVFLACAFDWRKASRSDVYHDTDVRAMTRQTVELDLKAGRGERFLEPARGGDPLSHEILCEVAADLTALGEPLPRALQNYMNVDAPAFKPKRGQPSWGRFRGEAIADAVTLLVAFKGFRPTRNRSHQGDDAHPPSACSLVAAALRQFGITKSEEAVQKAWEKGRGQNWLWVVSEAGWLMFLGWLPPEDLRQKPCPNCGEPHAPGQWFCQ